MPLLTWLSILFLYYDQPLSGLKQSHQISTSLDRSGLCKDIIEHLFEAAQNIRAILSALEVSAAPVITPYSSSSVFIAAHVNMYGMVSPSWYPGGQE